MVKKYAGPTVLIFRKRLLPFSETFIADQGQYLPSYRAVFGGFNLDKSGIELIKESPYYILGQYASALNWSKFKHRMGLLSDKNWLKHIAQYNPSLIHSHFLNDGIDAIKLGKQFDIPVLTTLHGHDITKPENRSFFGKDNQSFFNHIDRVIAVSDYIAQHTLKKGCPDHKLIKHSIGIDLQRFKLEKNESENPYILFVGRLTEKKGGTYLLQAMKKLKPKYPELKLTIVGEGNLKGKLQDEAAHYELDVEFAGQESAAQIKQRLAQCWLFVAPSITADNGDAEGLGMVFLEAQALQTPVVSFSSGGVVEAVEHESTGLLCEEKDVNSLAENIVTLLKSETLRREFGQRGRERVEKHFDVKKQCRILESIYDDVCRQG